MESTKQMKKTYQCESCNYTTPFIARWKVHKASHDSVKPYSCDICDNTFRTELHLEKHKSNVHAENVKYICPTCNLTFKTIQGLKHHTENIHLDQKDFECDVCYKSYSSFENLRKHKGRHQNKETLLCEFCENTYASKQALNHHVETTHSDNPKEKDKKCDICDFKTYDMPSLKTHIF